MVPAYLVLLLEGYNLLATIIFAAAAATDFVDGQVARRTNTVSRLGQILDPFVDRVLMVTGVLGVFLVGRLPLWVLLLVLARDAFIISAGAWLLTKHKIRIPVVYSGKAATVFLFVGFAGLLLNWPLIDGLGLVSTALLPGFNADPTSWGIWCIYIGLLLSLGTTVYYVVAARRKLDAKLAASSGESE